MATVSTYLSFEKETEEAFNFYKSVFGGDFIDGISRFSDIPPSENIPPLSDEEKNLVMHMKLEMPGGHLLMGSDVPKAMGGVHKGTNIHINIQPDSKQDADSFFQKLSKEGNVKMPMHNAFWGAYFGMCVDKFGIHWMINFNG